MPRRRCTAATSNRVADLRHDEAHGTSNPPSSIAPAYGVRARKTRCAHDFDLDPQPVWVGKAEHTSFDVNVVSLHMHVARIRALHPRRRRPGHRRSRRSPRQAAPTKAGLLHGLLTGRVRVLERLIGPDATSADDAAHSENPLGSRMSSTGRGGQCDAGGDSL